MSKIEKKMATSRTFWILYLQMFSLLKIGHFIFNINALAIMQGIRDNEQN